MNKSSDKGFTLIELLVVISIIALLSTMVFTSLNGARKRARDGRRFSDMNQIKLALELYKEEHGFYPEETSVDGDWETSAEDGGAFLEVLQTEGYFPNGVPHDPLNINGLSHYAYHLYDAGEYGCPVERGKYYVLTVLRLESYPDVYPDSPGWTCPSRDWEADGLTWVTGNFEN